MNTAKFFMSIIICCLVPFYSGSYLSTFSSVSVSSDEILPLFKSLNIKILFTLSRGLSNNETIVIRLPRFYGSSNYDNNLVLSPSNLFTAVWVRKLTNYTHTVPILLFSFTYKCRILGLLKILKVL